MTLPSLPPALQLVCLDPEVPAYRRAVRTAPRGSDEGTLYWTERNDRLEIALSLEPETPVRAALEAVYLLTVAAGDVLAHLLPPAVPIAYAWPGDLLLAGARTGRVCAALAPAVDATAIPPWLVLGLTIDLVPPADGPRRLPDRTSLYQQGADDVSAVELVERIARQFLRWTSRWLESGLEPARSAWNLGCFRRGHIGGLSLAHERIEGIVAGLDERGALVVGERRLTLDDALGLLR